HIGISVVDARNTKLESLDLSRWVPDGSKYADVEFTDGELLVRNKEKTFYYVLAGTESEKSVDADSRVTVRNTVNLDTNLGYGIVFHSNPIPLQQGYAFLIDAKKKRYRVVHHTPQKEDAVINWSRSDAILDGTQENTLEVRDKSDKIELYINGKMVNSIKNDYGYPGGVIGIYSSGALQVAFKDLEIRR
ncbi:MAG: family 16 glycoside hydrolase, partial [Acidobacteriota bacterium]